MSTATRYAVVSISLVGLLIAHPSFVAVAEEANSQCGEQRLGRHVTLSAQILTDSGISLEEAGPAPQHVTLPLSGWLTANEDKVAHMTARFPGIIREVRKRLGDSVGKGETLAVVESNQTIRKYEVQSLVSGIVTFRHATLGEFVGERSELFTVADYGELFADFSVFPADFEKIRLGQKMLVHVREGDRALESVTSFISPIIDPETQSRFIRAVLANSEAHLQPGGFVSGEVVLSEGTAALAVRASAIQLIEGSSIVFISDSGNLTPRRIVVGRNDGEFAEILAGLHAGERYASGNTFLLKAELSKGDGGHDE